MVEITLGWQNMQEVEISYLNKNDVESNIHRKIWLCKNVSIYRNIYDENNEIQGSIWIGTGPPFHWTN